MFLTKTKNLFNIFKGERKMKQKMLFTKTGFVLSLIACVSFIMVSQTSIAQEQEEYLLRAEVNSPNGEAVRISAPLSLINTLYDVMPKEIFQICKKLKLNPDVITNELVKMEGGDIVRITGRENIRVWIDTVDEDNEKDLNFVRVYVKEDRDEINVCVPRGLVQLTGQVIKKLGLADEFLELPDEIRKLRIEESL